MKRITNSKEETQAFARNFAKKLHGGELVLLQGDLGSGKTTFVAGLINYFIPHARVLSPTFTIVRHYKVEHSRISDVYHVDLYRLETQSEIEKLHIWELIYKPKYVILIEWAEKLGVLLPKKRIDVNITILSNDRREIITKHYG